MGDLKIRQLENELKKVKKELDQLKAGGRTVGNDQAMVLKEVVKRLAQLEMVDQARRFSNKLPPPNSDREIVLQNGHKYTPAIEAFIRNGAAYCHDLSISRGPNGSAFSGQPSDFFDNLIKHFHETENPDETVAKLSLALALNNPAPWPTVLAQLHVADLGLISKEQLDKDGVPTLTEEKVDYGDKMVQYTISNKHKSEARFKICIHFEGGAKCYQQMTGFVAWRTDVNEIAAVYARTIAAANSDGYIHVKNVHEYTPEMDIFLRYGDAHCDAFWISRGARVGFLGYPADFFDDLIKHYYETKVPTMAIRQLDIDLPLEKPAPWPMALVQPQAGQMKMEKTKVDNAGKRVDYILGNKHNPGIAFKLCAFFEGDAKCYQQMTNFVMLRVEDS